MFMSFFLMESGVGLSGGGLVGGGKFAVAI